MSAVCSSTFMRAFCAASSRSSWVSVRSLSAPRSSFSLARVDWRSSFRLAGVAGSVGLGGSGWSSGAGDPPAWGAAGCGGAAVGFGSPSFDTCCERESSSTRTASILAWRRRSISVTAPASSPGRGSPGST
jgi:hypothetical protein